MTEEDFDRWYRLVTHACEGLMVCCLILALGWCVAAYLSH